MKLSQKTNFIVFVALLSALSVVLKVYLGIPVNLFGGLAKDINLSAAATIFSGIFLGPLGGGLVGAITDLAAFLIRPLGAYNPLFTVTNALMGIIPALFFLKNKSGKFGFIRTALATLAAQTVCSFMINTLLLIWFFGLPPEVAWFRGISAFIMLPVYTALVYTLLTLTERTNITLPRFKKQPSKLPTRET